MCDLYLPFFLRLLSFRNEQTQRPINPSLSRLWPPRRPTLLLESAWGRKQASEQATKLGEANKAKDNPEEAGKFPYT